MGEAKNIQVPTLEKATPSLKGRAREIYLELCKYTENLPPGCSLPSIRELQKKYSAGQRVVVEALRALGKNRNIVSIPRKKIKVSEEPSDTGKKEDADALPGMPPWMTASRGTDTVLSMLCGNVAIWQPIVDRFNLDNENRKIKIRACDEISDLVSPPEHCGGDFILFPTSPILLGLVKSPEKFMNLGGLVRELGPESLHESAFESDAGGRIWGVAPTLTPIVIYHNGAIDKTASAEKSLSWNWRDFAEHAESLRAARPGLAYVHSLYAYMNFLLTWGVTLVDPGTGRIKISTDSLADAVEYLRRMASRRILPLYSQTENYSLARRMFNDSETAMRDGWAWERRAVLEAVSGGGMLAQPVAAGQARPIYSELFCVSADNMNYDVCFKFMKHAFSEESQTHLAGQKTGFPARKNIVPPDMPASQFEIMKKHIGTCRRRAENCSLPFKTGYVVEAGIDRLLLHGEKTSPAFFKELERSCQWHLDNIAWK